MISGYEYQYFYPIFLRKCMFTNKQISWVIWLLRAFQNKHMKIGEIGQIKLLPIDWRQMAPQFLYGSILWLRNFHMVILRSPYRAYDSRYLLICKHVFSEKIGKILILIPLSCIGTYTLYSNEITISAKAFFEDI